MINPFLVVVVVEVVGPDPICWQLCKHINPGQVLSCWSAHITSESSSSGIYIPVAFSSVQLSDILVFIRELSGSCCSQWQWSSKKWPNIFQNIIHNYPFTCTCCCSCGSAMTQLCPAKPIHTSLPLPPSGGTRQTTNQHQQCKTSHLPVPTSKDGVGWWLSSSQFFVSPPSAGLFVAWMLVFSTDSGASPDKKTEN